MQSRLSCTEQYSKDAECSKDNNLTLSQFVSNSSDYLISDTMLIILSGNHNLEAELNVENVH